MDRLNKVGVLESSLIKFVKSQMDTRTKRAQVYFTWIVFKPLNPDLGKIITALRAQKTPILLLTGEYDKMVTSQNLDRFSSKIPQLHPVELPFGHNSLIEKTAEYLLNKRGKINI
jgi:pimeloyl-ACP methyl ester carboxylesterase